MQSFPEYEINQTEVMCPRRERVRFNELQYTCNNVNGKSFFNPFIHRNDGRKQTEYNRYIQTMSTIVSQHLCKEYPAVVKFKTPGILLIKYWMIFTALHGMQTRSSDENSVCPSVCLSVTRVHCDKTEERSVQIFSPYERWFSLVYLQEEWLVVDDPFYLKFWVNRPPLEQNRRFSTDNRS